MMLSSAEMGFPGIGAAMVLIHELFITVALANAKKTRDTKGRFHARMGTIKDRNGMDPREAEDIEKR